MDAWRTVTAKRCVGNTSVKAGHATRTMTFFVLHTDRMLRVSCHWRESVFLSRICKTAPSALRLLLDDLRGLPGSRSSRIVLDCEWATNSAGGGERGRREGLHFRRDLSRWLSGLGQGKCAINKVARSLQDAVEVCQEKHVCCSRFAAMACGPQ